MKLSGKFAQESNSQITARLQAVTDKLAAKDPTLWGAGPAAEASIRLNWIDLPKSSRQLLPQLDALSAWARSNKLTEIVLCGMGGSSLAPEVIAATYKKKLTVLDSTDPLQIKLAIPSNLENSLFIIGSKSGSTIETSSQKSFFEDLLRSNGLEPKDHFVIVTDPNSPLDLDSRSKGYRVINADTNVGGRFSALSAFGLVPAALIGVDVSEMLDDADHASQEFSLPGSVPVEIAAKLFEFGNQFVTFCEEKSPAPGLSDWIEQLIAESTGKDQTGRLPVVINRSTQNQFGLTVGFAPGDFDLIVEASLGAQFILWEWVTALLCFALEVDPFNQPNVTEAKEQTSIVLKSKKSLVDFKSLLIIENSDYQIYSNRSVANLAEFLKQPVEYFAVMAYLTRGVDNKISDLQEFISGKSGKPTTFGWAPRFLHSTGQFHKGGQPNGGFIQITGESEIDLPVPGTDFTFNDLLMAQAIGDGVALRKRDYPFIQIHLKNRKAGISKLLQELEGN
ncbi:MAG: glucose-6-phosphate isomerase [Actinomycetes bacterium]